MTYVAVGGGSGICVEERAVEGYKFMVGALLEVSWKVKI